MKVYFYTHNIPNGMQMLPHFNTSLNFVKISTENGPSKKDKKYSTAKMLCELSKGLVITGSWKTDNHCSIRIQIQRVFFFPAGPKFNSSFPPQQLYLQF